MRYAIRGIFQAKQKSVFTTEVVPALFQLVRDLPRASQLFAVKSSLAIRSLAMAPSKRKRWSPATDLVYRNTLSSSLVSASSAEHIQEVAARFFFHALLGIDMTFEDSIDFMYSTMGSILIRRPHYATMM
ncbi:hypothetical protein PpBr36_04387 [Pyricularia pennisetigena]|uniref:hypothetical protein n=1 Tax=Pyricularia pennisetigena TaxID=1578925 RepID=UPI00115296D4|nr:hypothetical protein PpBr36_04387 [Pyricularia pennisetigena]TLS27118.1 hypothetical protein PpBr36_04387 [Pyricularia pennisetigena]